MPVYLALLYHADSHGRCFPWYHRIMEISGVRGKATVSRALRILRREGFLLIAPSHGTHGSNRYLLQSSITELKGSTIEPLKFNDETPKVQPLNSQSSIIEPELDPINYTQLTKTRELKENPPDFLFSKGRKEKEKEKEKEKHNDTYQLPPELCGWEKEEYRIPEWLLGDEDQER
ncbi:MAG: helix-turn-helix domain-containing protein [Candidatus Atribacteria bacterium]|nr:helix-turn-helix domain-containing protein [Candidatus Atribacteria bacterium]